MTDLTTTPMPIVWDSEFFGIDIVHVFMPADVTEADSAWMLIDANDLERIHAAEECGFTLADIRVTLERPEQGTWMLHNVGPAVEADHDPLAELARVAHKRTRYYNAGYDPQSCGELYATWMRNSLDGWADAVLTSGKEGEPTGYVTVHIEDDLARIGLIAVRKDTRAQGVGRQLVGAALERAALAGVYRMSVVTQGANLRALRLFERSGFHTVSVELWMHRWQR